MKGVDSNPNSGSRHGWLSNALVARQLFRDLTAFALGLALLIIYFRTPPRQVANHFLVAVFLLGVFELIPGAMMFVSAFERGPHMYWMAAIWSLIGGALIFSQALYPRSKENLR